MSEPKRHHILAETYQKHFIQEGNCVWVHDKFTRKTFTTQPINVAVRTDFNTALTPAGGLDRKTIESFFSNFEADYPATIAQLRSGVQTTDSINHAIAFMNLQVIRSPVLRQLMSDLLMQFSPKDNAALRAYGVHDVGLKLLEQARSGDVDAKIKIGLQSSKHLGLGVMNALKDVAYRTIRLDTPISLVSSDNPIVYFSVKRERGKWRSGLPLPSTRILCFFPLAKDILLFGDTEKPPFEQLFSERPSQVCNSVALVKRVNAINALTAERTIIAPTERDLSKTLSAIEKKNVKPNTLFSMCTELAKVAIRINNEHWNIRSSQ
ncbi:MULTISPECIES: DUF4238 domain-containing protein [Phaeobacter]|uniref:DUF4238 domain-containing protein n=1 Tax=Phaeobacter TaxID=302485 RepID=UPI0009F38DF6|nr:MULTISPECIES: DUF4238 domain-containing protein [Phaeobacter]MDE4061257.1 DUF4238 domain-containing protein [Phaeobacter gallaeciensis]MDE4124276.1 DUF4238 domain-containing protein [Phaeobacter gallaeciensis]MDE4128868.1 DUF4238 domain-containing protein [Phaeobacter gallaeciensis]PVZ45357.1 DUF4238 domain-containing protein [Phaeobacter sp. JL2872]